MNWKEILDSYTFEEKTKILGYAQNIVLRYLQDRKLMGARREFIELIQHGILIGTYLERKKRINEFEND